MSDALGLSAENLAVYQVLLRSPDQEYPIASAAGFDLLEARRQQEIVDLVGQLKADKAAAGKFVANYTDFIAQTNAGT